MITATTTRLMTVSWNIAHGKKGFAAPVDVLLVALELLAVFERGHVRFLSIGEPPFPRGRGSTRPSREAGRRSRPARSRPPPSDQGGGGDAETHHEVQVQADERNEPARDEQHVQRVEARKGVVADLRSPA